MNVLFAWRLQPHHPIPPTPTNEDRIRAYRALAPVALGNGRQWKWHAAAQYAREAAPSSEAEYVNQLRDGFALKYGSNA